jgi:hypothetical protein
MELLGLLFDEPACGESETLQAHLAACPVCTAACNQLGRAAALLEREPMEPAPAFAWPRLKASIDRTGACRDWDEPAWAPLILRNVAGILVAILLMVLAAGWLERADFWHSIQSWPVTRGIGPLSLAALVFFGAGALVTLALTPILWWETRRPHNGIVK